MKRKSKARRAKNIEGMVGKARSKSKAKFHRHKISKLQLRDQTLRGRARIIYHASSMGPK
ncbi:MAG: hypothetical protein A3C35_02020 [Omnitrophica bacterium RIFCSPHIGHO2_02_FULL_46_11]|nr:MAG: hypothetical protein A3C35_02020 [Omnitrophica bacterium RIFCSPHIGHO2_02_FULL_46_11]OGW87451.1 MAG: hypothetical protein A3A81_05765 [Omnitrophica bacterium RIFCSPLOWO2_01_FULL_45_10b]